MKEKMGKIHGKKSHVQKLSDLKVSIFLKLICRSYAILKEIHIYYFKVYKLDWIVKAM